MKIALEIARHEMRSLRREKLPQALLLVFVGMVSISSFIGWLTKRNVTGIWQKVRDSGFTTAPNPFATVPPLYYLRNTVIYLVLIGALLAIVLGVSSIIRERKAGTFDLILTHPMKASSYLLGKLMGNALWLGIILGFVTLISWISVGFITGSPLSLVDSIRLVGFFGSALVLLMSFTALGMLSAIYSSRETSALLIPISIWSVITFILPQLGTAEHPVSLLNPVPTIAAHGETFSILNSIFGPFSLTEQFKRTSDWILGNPDYTGNPTAGIVVITLALTLGITFLTLTRRDRLRQRLDE